VKARTLELLLDTTKSLRQQQARVAERSRTDVKVNGVSLPAEVAQSVPFQAYAQVLAHLQAQLDGTRKMVEVSVQELQAYKADVQEQRNTLPQQNIADLARKHPHWAAETFKAQEEHRWFERALEGEEEEESPAAHGTDAHAASAAPAAAAKH
jgi:hypothetical protein